MQLRDNRLTSEQLILCRLMGEIESTQDHKNTLKEQLSLHHKSNHSLIHH